MTNPSDPPTETPTDPVVAWLLDADPAVRWQVLRDVVGAPPDEVGAERARVATTGLGARLLALQGDDGAWGAVAWNHGWDSTMHVLTLLRDLGLEPASEPARRALALVAQRVVWPGWGPDGGDNPYFVAEVEPCINGQVAAAGAYFGQDVTALAQRLVGEQLADGGWNCEAENGSTRSSFDTTICVLEALVAAERAALDVPGLADARRAGHEYLLDRRLFRRLSTGEPIARDRVDGSDWTRFASAPWWHYDVLRALDHLRDAGVVPDERVDDALGLVAARRQDDGRWLLDTLHPGPMPVDLDDGVGRPSRWVTLRALRVLAWGAAR